MSAQDREARAELVHLAIQQTLEFLKQRPTLAQVEELSAIMKSELEAAGERFTPADAAVYRRPGAVMGRCATMVHNIIYNLELGDYVERNNRFNKGTTGERGSDGSAARAGVSH